MSVRPYVLTSARQSVYPSIRPSFLPSVRPSVRQSIRSSVYPSVRPTLRPSVRPSIRPSIRPSVRASVLPSVRPSVRPSIRPSVRPSIRPYAARANAANYVTEATSILHRVDKTAARRTVSVASISTLFIGWRGSRATEGSLGDGLETTTRADKRWLKHYISARTFDVRTVARRRFSHAKMLDSGQISVSG